ncbi:MAG: ABC transporter permease [Phycisphaerae bacterium]|nr:ABC transporter permease [Phycisphaerae bacterium]
MIHLKRAFYAILRWILGFFRVLYQSIHLALSQIWANKTRAVLTMLGIIIAVASVTAVIAALSGLKAKILSQVKTFGTNTIFIMPTRPDEGPKQHASWWEIRFEPEQFDDLMEHCPSISKLGRQSSGGRHTVSFRDRSAENVNVNGIEPDCFQIESRTFLLGRPLSLMDEMQTRQVCIIDPRLQNELRLKRDCIGQQILIGHNAFIVVGVIEPRPSSPFGDTGSENYEIFIPFKTNLKLQPYPWIYAIAESRSAEVSEDAVAELRFFFRRTRNLEPGEPDTFRVESLKSALEQFNQIAIVVTMVAGGIVGISLLVGGVGIMNIMLVSVSERTREIGLRKAVGARRSAILTQFLIESVVLCFIGGLIGIGIGYLLTQAIANIPKAELDMAHIPWQAVAISFAFSGTVGIFFGMFPAIKAARLDPIEALRHE